MTEFTYNQTVEYIDGTRDLNFEAARRWAREQGATFEEDVSKREPYNEKRIETYLNPETGAEYQEEVDYPTLKRFFVIGSEPQPYVPPEPTVEQMQSQKRKERDEMMRLTQDRIDRYRNQKDAGLTTTDSLETFAGLLNYVQYLRDFTLETNWHTLPVLPFEVWLNQ